MLLRFGRHAAWFLPVLVTVVLLHPAWGQSAELNERIRELLLGPVAALDAVDPMPHAVAALRGFYQDRGFDPLWRGGAAGASERSEALLTVLRHADQEGLVPVDYLRGMPMQTVGASPDVEAHAELRTSLVLLRYIRDLRWGRSWLVQYDASLFRVERTNDWARLLYAAAQADDLAHFLDAQAPLSPAYRELRSALARYRRYAAVPDPALIAAGEAIKPGSRDPRIPVVRARLLAVGAISSGGGAPPEEDLYDPQLVSAVESYQGRFGLTADGIIGRATIRALNRSAAQLVETITLNMERLRWMPDDLGRRYVLVNIAAFSLLAIDGEEKLEMRVIVGSPYRMTPIFSDRIRYLEFNPYWTVPRRIVVEDLLPKARSLPGYLKSQNIRIFDGWDDTAVELAPEDIDWQAIRRGSVPYRFRQEPGPRNALGRVKFMFPNKHDVYIHDTPSRSLFQQDFRPFSSGCIRAEKPMELAAFLLRHEAKWDVQRLQALIDSGLTSRIHLADPVPVHLTYVTAWADTDGEVRFREDVYGRDRLLAEAVRRH